MWAVTRSCFDLCPQILQHLSLGPLIFYTPDMYKLLTISTALSLPLVMQISGLVYESAI